jgi:hypothetical protein
MTEPGLQADSKAKQGRARSGPWSTCACLTTQRAEGEPQRQVRAAEQGRNTRTWRSWLARLLAKEKVAGSNPVVRSK